MIRVGSYKANAFDATGSLGEGYGFTGFIHVGYLMISSACSSTDCGIVSPSALAVFRLITSSNLEGFSMGRSPGLAPFRILSTIGGAAPSHVDSARPKGHETASLHELPLVHTWTAADSSGRSSGTGPGTQAPADSGEEGTRAHGGGPRAPV